MRSKVYKIFQSDLESVELFATALSKNPLVKEKVNKTIFTWFFNPYTFYLCIVFSERYKDIDPDQVGVILLTLSYPVSNTDQIINKHLVEEVLEYLPASLRYIFISNLDLFTKLS